MEKAKQMIGYHLVTKQTTGEGRLCEEVMIAKRLFTRREYYFSITLDRVTNVRIPPSKDTVWIQGPILIGSSRGGMNIEEVAATDPTAIIKVPIDINTGVTDKIANDMAEKMGFKVGSLSIQFYPCFQDLSKAQAADIIKKLYNLFIKSDCSLLEINPMSEDVDGNGMSFFPETLYCKPL